LVGFLRTAGHNVAYIAEAAAGLSDADVIDLASRETRLLLTEDKDFGDLVFRRERTESVARMREAISGEGGAIIGPKTCPKPNGNPAYR
jgi:predicted nuclease of predicted toxin-antitoxin system